MQFRRAIVATLLVSALASCSGTSSFAPPQGGTAPNGARPDFGSGGPLPEPPVVTAKHHVATVKLVAEMDASTGYPTFSYNGKKGVIPTIAIDPGDTFVIDVIDALPKHGDSMGSDMNLHFHGLTVSPKPPADNVTSTLAMPGGSLHYVVHVPDYQDPGLYWYHPHVMGQTNYQVGLGGMSGAIVINGIEKHLPALAQMTQHVLIVRDTPLLLAMPPKRHPRAEGGGGPCATEPALLLTVDGVSQPEISIGKNEQQFFRVINATGHRTLDLTVDNGELEIVAIDGFPLDVASPGKPTARVRDYVLPTAGRVEFVVKGSRSGSSALRTQCFNAGPNGDPNAPDILAHLVAPANSNAAAHERAIAIGAPLPNNGFAGPLPPATVERTVVLSEDNNAMYINGKAFAMDDPPMFTAHVGTIERWRIVNVTQEVHDFHIHQTHFLVEKINGRPVSNARWMDSSLVPNQTAGGPGSITVLMDFRPSVIKGVFMFHCHILDHEDAGMMAKIRVI